MKKFLIGSSIFLIIILGTYFFLKSNYYLSSNSSDARRIAGIAVEQNKPLLCGKIIMPIRGFNPNTAASLKAECYFSVAQQLKNPEVCNFISDLSSEDYKGICITNIAVETNDMNSCELITEQLSKGGCYENFTKKGTDRSICEKVGDANNNRISGRNLCYLGAANYSGDISICDTNIQGQENKNSCYISIAEKTNNISLCDKVESYYSQYPEYEYIQEKKDDCKNYIKTHR